MATVPLSKIGPSREVITEKIAARKAAHDRLPVHYRDQRAAIMDEIDHLVDDWLAAPA